MRRILRVDILKQYSAKFLVNGSSRESYKAGYWECILTPALFQNSHSVAGSAESVFKSTGAGSGVFICNRKLSWEKFGDSLDKEALAGIVEFLKDRSLKGST